MPMQQALRYWHILNNGTYQLRPMLLLQKVLLQ